MRHWKCCRLVVLNEARGKRGSMFRKMVLVEDSSEAGEYDVSAQQQECTRGGLIVVALVLASDAATVVIMSLALLYWR
jgi:hypothetical protein